MRIVCFRALSIAPACAGQRGAHTAGTHHVCVDGEPDFDLPSYPPRWRSTFVLPAPPAPPLMSQMELSLSLDAAQTLLLDSPKGNTVPVSVTLPADVLTPVICYLRLTNGAEMGESFLLESVVRGETAGRWSFIGNSASASRTSAAEVDSSQVRRR